ncbi:helix-turn-helix transcriptional regulator [Paenibacillus donghaensis]|uniref:AraC family transcriptional regulator n=1 Tax=Paenibacillus donghaensis TaxID=414771 RepID=A0A2Z2KAD6_9BACL|nr:AraC family transcriptional regulator [Paenibacillus donghaensis]ASA22437.1 AraC family transcriptional regulator [Paenibacillus donghaensis]
MNSKFGTFGFRFSEDQELPLCGLFAVGHEMVDTPSYIWDGNLRNDGPLLLFQYTVAGEGTFELGNHRHQIGPEQAFLAEIPGNHRYYYSAAASQPWEFYFLLFRPALVLQHWKLFIKECGETPQLSSRSLPIRLLYFIFAEAFAGRITDPLLSSSYVYQFVTELCRFPTSNLRNRAEWPTNVRQASEYIEQYYASMISMEQLSEQVSLSKYHLIRRFAEITGMTPNSYLNRVRTEKAMELLRHTDSSIQAIAGQVGYSSGSYFIKAFRNLTGLTPGEFRSGQDNLLYQRLFFD